MKTYSTLLVDDEHLALGLLENFCRQLPELVVVGSCRSAIEARQRLASEAVDILFLDIQMPVLSGTNLLRTLPQVPATIFTTAYSEHAAEAFDLNAVDYLLKPFSFERFLQAVGKAQAFLKKQEVAAVAAALVENPAPGYLVCKVDGRLEKIFFSDIIAVEGMREYVKIICPARQFITLESMKNMEDALPTGEFVRVHKSHIVAKRAVRSLDGNLLVLEKGKVPVSRERKEVVVRSIFGV